MKYLLLALALIWLFYSPALRRQLHKPSAPPSPPPTPEAKTPPVQVMLTCAHCGIHFPQSEALTLTHNGQSQHYCCKAHLQTGPRSR
ncbi:MAG: hypothetical protein KGL57_01575 [Burkholderiales bacterium]|nr:hypothetical protein [Burkholderiales bacterium]